MVGFAIAEQIDQHRWQPWVVFSCGNTLPCSSHAILDRTWVATSALSCLRHFPSWVLDQLQTFPLCFCWSVRVEWRGVTPPRQTLQCSGSSVCRDFLHPLTLLEICLFWCSYSDQIFKERDLSPSEFRHWRLDRFQRM